MSILIITIAIVCNQEFLVTTIIVRKTEATEVSSRIFENMHEFQAFDNEYSGPLNICGITFVIHFMDGIGTKFNMLSKRNCVQTRNWAK